MYTNKTATEWSFRLFLPRGPTKPGVLGSPVWRREGEHRTSLAVSTAAMAHLSMGEAHRRITEYLNNFSDSVYSQDAASLKRLLSFSSDSPSLLSLADSLNLFQVSFSLFVRNSLSNRFVQLIDWDSACRTPTGWLSSLINIPSLEKLSCPSSALFRITGSVIQSTLILHMKRPPSANSFTRIY